MHDSVETDLQNINALPTDVAKEFIFLIKVSPKHLGGLVYCMFYLHRDSPSNLRLLHHLDDMVNKLFGLV